MGSNHGLLEDDDKIYPEGLNKITTTSIKVPGLWSEVLTQNSKIGSRDTHLIIFGTLAYSRSLESAQNAVCTVYSAPQSSSFIAIKVQHSSCKCGAVSAVSDVLKDHIASILRVKQSLLDCCYYHWPNDAASQDLILQQHCMAFLHSCNI